jgi:hypothetical protein
VYVKSTGVPTYASTLGAIARKIARDEREACARAEREAELAKMTPAARKAEEEKEERARLKHEKWLTTPEGKRATEQERNDRLRGFLIELGIAVLSTGTISDING